MASAWGSSWGQAFGAAFGSIGAPTAPAPTQPLGGVTIRRSGGRRRVLTYIDPIPDPDESNAIETIATNAAPMRQKRARTVRERDHLLLLH